MRLQSSENIPSSIYVLRDTTAAQNFRAPSVAAPSFVVNFLARNSSLEVIMPVKPIPDGYHTLTPFLTVRDAVRAIEFYKQAFGAVERGVMKGPDGKVMHAELKIGDSIIMLSDEFPEFGTVSPQTVGGSPMGLHVYVDGVDAAFDRAVKAGAQVEMPVMDQFWGDRYGKLKDPFGHKWSIATHTKDLSMDEMKSGMDEAMAQFEAKKSA
jgi:PhnB protein